MSQLVMVRSSQWKAVVEFESVGVRRHNPTRNEAAYFGGGGRCGRRGGGGRGGGGTMTKS